MFKVITTWVQRESRSGHRNSAQVKIGTIKKIRPIFTLRESRVGCISFVVQGSRYKNTASPWTPRICNLRGFYNN